MHDWSTVLIGSENIALESEEGVSLFFVQSKYMPVFQNLKKPRDLLITREWTY